MGKYDAVLIENIWHELRAIREGYESLARVPRILENIEGRLDRIESVNESFKIWLKDHDKMIDNHDGRIAKLETAR